MRCCNPGAVAAFIYRLVVLIVLAAPMFDVLAGVPPVFAPRGPGGGGALFSPSWSPHRAGELFLACDMSELFHTTNFGARWQAIDFRQLQGNRDTCVQFTSDPDLLYALDCTSVDGGDTRRPSRSLDGGRTWQPLASDPTGMDAYSLYADVERTNRILVADYYSIYLSTNGGATFAAKYTSASDWYISGVFWDGANIYIGTTAGLLVSTNGGYSFALASVPGIPAGQEIASLAGARQGGTTRLLCVTVDSGTLYQGMLIEDAYYSYRGVYALDVGQPAWVVRTNGTAAGQMFLFAGMARGDVSTMYLAGEDNGEYPVVLKSTNGGASWAGTLLAVNNSNVVTGWSGWQGDRDYTYDAHYVGFSVAPNDPLRLALSGYGFIHYSTNGGTSWQQGYTRKADEHPAGAPTPKYRDYHSVGLEDTTCWWLNWADSNNVFACYSDIRGLRSTNGGLAWSFNYTGHTYNSMYHMVTHSNGTLYAAVASVHDLYQSTHLTDARLDVSTGEVLYSIDKGATWQRLHNFTNAVFALALDPARTNRLYAGVVHSARGGWYRTDNLSAGTGATWTRLPAPPRTQGHPFQLRLLDDGALVCTYSGRMTGNVFTASSGLFVSFDGGTNWIDRSHTNMWYWTKDVVIDPFDPGQSNWYVGVFSGWGGAPNGKGGLFRTTNRGVSWARLIAADRVTSCAFNPVSSNELYFTTEGEGLWFTTNARAASPSFINVGHYPFRQPERVVFNPFNPREVWITSFGHGMRCGSTAPMQIQAISAGPAGPVVTWPVPDDESYSIDRAAGAGLPFLRVGTNVEGGSWMDSTGGDAAIYRLSAP